jgi:lambda repressor-like predicted transcriptional regulator
MQIKHVVGMDVHPRLGVTVKFTYQKKKEQLKGKAHWSRELAMKPAVIKAFTPEIRSMLRKKGWGLKKHVLPSRSDTDANIFHSDWVDSVIEEQEHTIDYIVTDKRGMSMLKDWEMEDVKAAEEYAGFSEEEESEEEESESESESEEEL